MAEDLPDWSHEVVVVKELLVTFDMSTSEGIFPLRVKFYPFIIGGTAPFTFEWDFGDGSAKSTEREPTHVYNEPGDYIVTLKVQDATGLQTQCSRMVKVTAVSAKVITGLVFAENIMFDFEDLLLAHGKLFTEEIEKTETAILSQHALDVSKTTENINFTESINIQQS